MKSITTIVGIILMILGVMIVSYQGFHYTKKEKILQLGDLQVTADTQKRVDIPPLLGGLIITVGVIILVVGRIKK